jgi:hypothetical protein
MEPQVALLDRDIWPDSRHQLLLADNFAGVFDKNDKNVERPSTQMNWAARLLKVSVRRAQAKWTERNKVRSRSGLFVSHLHSLNSFGGRNVELLRVRESFYIFKKVIFRTFHMKHPAMQAWASHRRVSERRRLRSFATDCLPERRAYPGCKYPTRDRSKQEISSSPE